MLFFENRNGDSVATMHRSTITAAKEPGWTLFEGDLTGDAAVAVVLASSSGDLVVVFGETKAQANLDSPTRVTAGSHTVTVSGRFYTPPKP